VPHAGIAADQDELLEHGLVRQASSSQNMPFDRHVHDRLGRLLAGRQVQHVSHALDGPIHGIPVLDRTGDDLKPGTRLQLSVVAKRAHDEAAELGIAEQPPDDGLAHLAGGAGDEDSFGVGIRHVRAFLLGAISACDGRHSSRTRDRR
jgi:hypothetical protein